MPRLKETTDKCQRQLREVQEIHRKRQALTEQPAEEGSQEHSCTPCSVCKSRSAIRQPIHADGRTRTKQSAAAVAGVAASKGTHMLLACSEV